MSEFPTDFYAVAAQILPLLFLVALVEQKFLSKLDEDVEAKKKAFNDAQGEEKHETHAQFSAVLWAYAAVTVGVMSSFVLAEVAALRALADMTATAEQAGFVVAGLVSGGTLLIWFPLRIPFRHMRDGEGFTKLVGRIGLGVLALMLSAAAFGPLIYAMVVVVSSV